MSGTYYVWKRNDGYVASTTYMPKDYITKSGNAVSFELLGKFPEWNEKVVDFIIAETVKAGSLE